MRVSIARHLFFGLLLIFMVESLHAQAQDSLQYVSQLAEMKAKDQKLRQKLGALKSANSHPDSIRIQELLVGAFDKAHRHKLKVMWLMRGLPTKSSYGMQAAHDFWLLVMHQDGDTAFQKEVLAAMWTALDSGEVVDRDVAYLDDRVAIAEGRCQTYGTQNYRPDGSRKLKIFPVCDRRGLNKVRATMRLRPIRKQLRLEQKNAKKELAL